MEKEKIEEYSNHYKRVQKRLTIVMLVLIIILGIALISSGVLIMIVNQDYRIVIVGSLMIFLGLFDMYIGIRFNIKTQKRLNKMNPKEAAERYMKITGAK